MNTNFTSTLITALIVLGVLMLIFLAIRAILLWYWKIDTIVDNQQKQIDLLQEIAKNSKANSGNKITS